MHSALAGIMALMMLPTVDLYVIGLTPPSGLLQGGVVLMSPSPLLSSNGRIRLQLRSQLARARTKSVSGLRCMNGNSDGDEKGDMQERRERRVFLAVTLAPLLSGETLK